MFLFGLFRSEKNHPTGKIDSFSSQAQDFPSSHSSVKSCLDNRLEPRRDKLNYPLEIGIADVNLTLSGLFTEPFDETDRLVFQELMFDEHAEEPGQGR